MSPSPSSPAKAPEDAPDAEGMVVEQAIEDFESLLHAMRQVRELSQQESGQQQDGGEFRRARAEQVTQMLMRFLQE